MTQLQLLALQFCIFVATCFVLFAASKRYRRAVRLNMETEYALRSIQSAQHALNGKEVFDPRTYAGTLLTKEQGERYIRAGTVSASDEVEGALKMVAPACTCGPVTHGVLGAVVLMPDLDCPVHYPVVKRD